MKDSNVSRFFVFKSYVASGQTAPTPRNVPAARDDPAALDVPVPEPLEESLPRRPRLSISLPQGDLVHQELANTSSPCPDQVSFLASFFSVSISICLQFPCLCNKSYSSKSGLKNHQRFCKVVKEQKKKENHEVEVSDSTSDSDVSFTCPICQACLKSKASLGIHVLKHR